MRFFPISFDQTKHHHHQQQQQPRQREFYLLFSSLCFSLLISVFTMIFSSFFSRLNSFVYILTTSSTLHARSLILFSCKIHFLPPAWRCTRPAYETSCFCCAPFGRFMASSMKINFSGLILSVCVCLLCCALADNRLPNCLWMCSCVCEFLAPATFVCLFHFVYVYSSHSEFIRSNNDWKRFSSSSSSFSVYTRVFLYNIYMFDIL